LHGFLGLTGYCCKFVKNYGKNVAPLIYLFKNNAFNWTLKTDQSIHALNESMCMTSVLALPNFTKTFVLECDASEKGIGVVLMQEGMTLAFTSKNISYKHLGQSIYEKEMFYILHVVDIWHPYLLGKCVHIKTGHQSLKYFLEQKNSSTEQQKWVTKISVYNYDIIYKKVK